MTITVMAINPGHNGSTALVQDGKLIAYIEEERLSRLKYDGNPFRGMIDFITKVPKIDVLVMGGTGQEEHRLPWTGENSYHALVRKYHPEVQFVSMNDQHHMGHAAATFLGSGFDTAVAIIADGAGSNVEIPLGDEEDENVPSIRAYETESIWQCGWFSKDTTKDFGLEPVYKRYADNNVPFIKSSNTEIDSTVTITKAYEAVSQYLGFGYIEAGKTMGLAPYGKSDDNIPKFFLEDLPGRGDKNVLVPNYPAGANLDQGRIPYIQQKEDPREWHKDPSKLPDVAKNLAWQVQKETQEAMGDLIEKAVDMTGENNVVISGGYGLNVVANYYYKERFPDLNIYIDPIAHDGGTSIGLAKLICFVEMGKADPSVSIDKDPLTSLYLGLQPDPRSYDNIDELESPESGAKVTKVEPKDVAQLIKDRNIVSIFQGRAEGGPRALGNRSILYDPTDPDGKDKVNVVKGREWFRPFAGSVMQEHAKEWFDLRGMDETPFMMYAVELQDKAIGEIPAITHVDGTCRIQTVTKEQNENYYNLINEFYKLSGVPILFNTSFNLGGEPLVENLRDGITTLYKSKLEYMYLPEVGKLVYVDNSCKKDPNIPDPPTHEEIMEAANKEKETEEKQDG